MKHISTRQFYAVGWVLFGIIGVAQIANFMMGLQELAFLEGVILFAQGVFSIILAFFFYGLWKSIPKIDYDEPEGMEKMIKDVKKKGGVVIYDDPSDK